MKIYLRDLIINNAFIQTRLTGFGPNINIYGRQAFVKRVKTHTMQYLKCRLRVSGVKQVKNINF